MSDERPWGELTSRERAERIAEGRRRAREERETEAANDPVETPPEMAVAPEEESPLGMVSEAQERALRRAELLAGVPAEVADRISDDDLAKIEAEAQKKAHEESVRLAMATAKERASQKARVAANLIDQSVLRSEAEMTRLMEPVTFKIDVPVNGMGDSKRHQLGIRIDGFIYQLGEIYTRPRAVADSIREMMYRAHVNELEFKSLEQNEIYRRGDQVTSVRRAALLLSRRPMLFEVVGHA